MALVTYAVQVLTTATQLFPPATGVTPGGKRISIFNAGPNAIHVGAATVTTATGLKILAGAEKTLLPGGDPNSVIFAIAEVALQVTPADTRVMIETGG